MKKILLILVFGFIFSCSNTNQNSNEIPDKSHRLKKICIEGHIYFYGYFGYGRTITIKLDDNGKPVKCPEKENCCK